MKRKLIAVTLLVLCLALRVFAADGGLQKGDRVAVCGDSITEQKLYSMFIEDYLIMCKPTADLTACQFGWGGETAGGFNGRMNNDCLWLKPTVATTCYGMNDGGYRGPDANITNSYKNNTRSIVQKFKAGGARLIIVGSPGVVDSTTYRGGKVEEAAVYNTTLAGLRDAAKAVATEEGVAFADVHTPMFVAMGKAKASLGNRYAVAGGDGVHPDRNGHLIMAYAYLKAMGCDGNIGTITVDLAANKAEATDGHKVLSAANGAVEVESSRYPFCFYGDGKSAGSTRSILPFFPFNDELNRFRLVVKGGKAQNYKVTWGETSKPFSAADLAKGINLAAEFLDNPFSEPFATVERKVAAQEGFETMLHKDVLHNFGNYKNMLPDAKDAIDQVMAAAMKKQKELSDASCAAVAPVKHTIKIEAQ